MKFKMTVLAAGLLSASLLTSCAVPSPADQVIINTDQVRIEREITTACLGSGLFKLAGGVALAAVPLASTLLDAGVDVVCASPSRFARDASTVEWLTRHLVQKISH